nr:putative metal-binding motif-containing protein [Deltaproteobacteria bacterium]
MSSTCANAFRGATPTCPPSVRVRGGRVTGTDCEDGDANVRPNQTEACNQRDDNCNDMIDEGVTSENWYLDRDGDGHAGAGEAATLACAAPSARHVRVNDDCDDTDPLVSPGAPEVCDGATRDENCNGMRNEDCGCAPIGSSQACCGTRGTQTCTGSPMGSTWSACSATTMPEVCDGIDNNCDGNVDERAVNGPGDGGVGDGGTGDGGTGDGGTALGSLRVNCYRDMDGDGFAVARSSMESLCPPGSTAGVCPNGFTTRAPAGASTTDCDDVSTVARGRFPGNREICNNLDDNCDGRTDEVCPCAVGAMQPCYGGPSGTPGVGQCRSGTQRCDATSGGGAAWGTCSGKVRPGTEIRCNGADENCNGNGDDTDHRQLLHGSSWDLRAGRVPERQLDMQQRGAGVPRRAHAGPE